MPVSGLSFDLFSALQFVVTALVLGVGLVQVIKATASRYFVVDARFEDGDSHGHADDAVDRQTVGPAEVTSRGTQMSGSGATSLCFVCGESGKKICSGCKAVRYCSTICQAKHWKDGHKLKCKDLKFSNSRDSKSSSTCKVLKQANKVLFPYDEFVKLFNWNNPDLLPPCGLLNCGNSCFANVVLQCLSCTRPLVAYLLEKDHTRKCNRNDWCFLCELECHVDRVNRSLHPFSPINILSRLPNIGANLGYGKQEDAHEFMRFAIDTMQSVFLDEFGGESALDPSSQQTTLIQHIFGGHLQSQVICTKCDNISYCYENMMDLTVEIQGDATSLEKCLDQFTKKEWLDGENMYKCDECNDYVQAWKRLTVHQPPNILTIALKRFQSGRFGKLNKRVTFPETLDLGPYMSGSGDGTDLYKLYAVVVHVDMLNASFFGHYICYIKDFGGNWYRIDDSKVMKVELEEVLAQGAYMLLYSRINVRQPCVKPLGPTQKEERLPVEVAPEVCQDSRESFPQIGNVQLESSVSPPGCLTSDLGLQSRQEPAGMDLVYPINVEFDPVREDQVEVVLGNAHSSSSGSSSTNFDSLSEQSSVIGPHKMEFQESRSSSVGSNISESSTDYLFLNEMSESRCSGIPNAALQTGTISAEANPSISISHSNPRSQQDLVTPDPSGLRTGITSRPGKVFCGIENEEVKASVPLRDKSISNRKPKPLFCPGFLDKSSRKKSLKKGEEVEKALGEECHSRTIDSNCNSFGDPICAYQNGGNVNEQNDASMEIFHGNCEDLLDSEKPLLSPEFFGRRSVKIPLDEAPNGHQGKVDPTCDTDCNGDAGPVACDQEGIEVCIHHVRPGFVFGNGKDVSVDVKGHQNNDKKANENSEIHTCKDETICNGIVDTVLVNQNGNCICKDDKRSVVTGENGNDAIRNPTLQCKPSANDVPQDETDRIGSHSSMPNAHCDGKNYTTDGSEICDSSDGPGACWENSKDVHRKRPRQVHD